MRRIRILMLILFTSFVSTIWSQAQAGQKHEITTFDITGAGTGSGQGTFPIGIVENGWIMGSYIDANNVSHGFLRAPDGAISKFDVPGAGTSPFQGTVVVRGMNQPWKSWEHISTKRMCCTVSCAIASGSSPRSIVRAREPATIKPKVKV